MISSDQLSSCHRSLRDKEGNLITKQPELAAMYFPCGILEAYLTQELVGKKPEALCRRALLIILQS